MPLSFLQRVSLEVADIVAKVEKLTVKKIDLRAGVEQDRLEPFLDQLAPGPLDRGNAGVQRR
jgi:hypothetical protein